MPLSAEMAQNTLSRLLPIQNANFLAAMLLLLLAYADIGCYKYLWLWGKFSSRFFNGNVDGLAWSSEVMGPALSFSVSLSIVDLFVSLFDIFELF